MTDTVVEPVGDPHRPERVTHASGLLATFNEAGVLDALDVHLAATLGRLGGEADDRVLLAAALASRGPRMGHVRVELATVHLTVTTDDGAARGVDDLDWPPLNSWLAALRASPLVTEGRAPGTRPLRLHDGAVYLDRYWRHERIVAAQIRARAGRREDDPAPQVVAARPPDEQGVALTTAARRPLTVIAGGPGTGKTTTVARLLVHLAEQAVATDRPFPRVALTAPTGKAANRMEASIADAARELTPEGAVRDWLAALGAATVQRLLGSYGMGTRFRHDRAHPLPHDVVVVDEASMIAVSLMARLLEAVRPAARLVIVGDPDQLASVEAGAVLGDVVAGALEDPDGAASPTPGLRDAVVVLSTVHRFAPESGMAELAGTVRDGDADAAVAALRAGHPDLRWLDLAQDDRGDAALAEVRQELAAVGADRRQAAERGETAGALAALDRVQVLCAHRRGPAGAVTLAERVRGWLHEPPSAVGGDGTTPPGTPLMVTANDYALGLFNGDVGVVVDRADGGVDRASRRVAFGPATAPRLVSQTRLGAVESVHAMTIHKSQGSEFAHAVVVLPDEDSRLLTRELLYTSITRARDRLTLVASEASLRAAIERRVRRASGLRAALRGAGSGAAPDDREGPP